jgi:Zinc-finger of C2H2 type
VSSNSSASEYSDLESCSPVGRSAESDHPVVLTTGREHPAFSCRRFSLEAGEKRFPVVAVRAAGVAVRAAGVAVRAPVVAVQAPVAVVHAPVRAPASTVRAPVRAPIPGYRIPRLPEGEVRRRSIAVGERLLREDHHRRTRPVISRGRKSCRICKIDCSSLVVYREHLTGRRHKSAAARHLAGEQHCEICDITIETKGQFDKHLGGRRHRKAILDKAHSADRAASLALLAVSIRPTTSVFSSPRTEAPHFRSAPLPR